MIRALTLETLQIPFKVAFRHAAASRDATSSLWVEAVTASGARGRGESCPRPYVTGESMETAHVFFERHKRGDWTRGGGPDKPARLGCES